MSRLITGLATPGVYAPVTRVPSLIDRLAVASVVP
jgi:hypothetical protein